MIAAFKLKCCVVLRIISSNIAINSPSIGQRGTIDNGDIEPIERIQVERDLTVLSPAAI